MSRRPEPKPSSGGEVSLGNPADLTPVDVTPAAPGGRRKQFSVQLDRNTARAVRGAYVFSMYHGPVAGMRIPTDWVRRGMEELLVELEQEHNDGKVFPVVKGRIPRSDRGGALDEGTELDQFNVYLPVELEGRMRSAVLFFRANGAGELGILTKAEFYSVALARLVSRMEAEYGEDFASYYREHPS